MVETFYQNISTIYRTLREKHKVELRSLVTLKARKLQEARVDVINVDERSIIT